MAPLLAVALLVGSAAPGSTQEPTEEEAVEAFGAPTLFDRGTGGGMALGTLAVEGRPSPALVTAGEHFRAGTLGDRGELVFAGRTVGLAGSEPAGDDEPSLLRVGDRVRVTVPGARPGERLRALRTGRSLPGGRTALHAVALLEVESVAESSAVAAVTRLFGAYRSGDPVVRTEAFRPLSGGLAPVSDGRLVRVLAPEDPGSLVTAGDRLFLDAGSAYGLRPGDEFELLSAAPASAPAEPLGTARVVRTERNSSTARILRLRSARLPDVVRARHVRTPREPRP